MRIAVLDNDPGQSEQVCKALSAIRHTCDSFRSSAALLEHCEHESCDLLLLDSQATGMDIGSFFHQVRTRHPGLPVLLMTRRVDEEDVVAALAAGANDYIVKPIRHGELRLRVQTLLMRTYPTHKEIEQTRIGPYTFDTGSATVLLAGSTVDLTQKEFELALLFFHHLGRPLSRAFIRETIWAREADVPSRTIDTHVSRVRTKLKLRPENGFQLLPVYSFGYRLEQVGEHG